MTDEPALNNWRRKSGLLSWGMEIPAEPDEDPATVTKRIVLDTARLLEDFASPRTAYWSTESGGEDALVQDLRSGAVPAIEQLDGPSFPDLQRVSLALDLQVVYPSPPTARTLENDGTVHIEYEHELRQDPDGAIRSGVYLNLSLDVDIYARRAYTAAGDNHVLANLNAPRLNRYLRALQEHFGQPFTYIEYEGDRSQLDHTGFIDHDEAS